jgi:hypothetical protein
MLITLVDIDDAVERLAAGEQAYEYKTEDPKLRILGPACGFGADCLRIYREQGQYAESIAEAQDMARAKSLTVMGVWFVKPPR